ncbi:MAG: hypothetical protein ABIN61_07480 [candidate division WOR-3 bacterium]
MKRNLLFVILIPLLGFGISSTGVGVEETKVLVPVPMGIIDWVEIWIQRNSITWDFNRINRNSNNPPFPPPSFPAYYEPSQPFQRHYQRIRYRVRGIGWPAGNWQVTIAGSGDPSPSCGILLSDIEFGDGDLGIWTPLSTTPQIIASGSGDVGWQEIYQDYRVKLTGDETRTELSTTIIIYTIQVL